MRGPRRSEETADTGRRWGRGGAEGRSLGVSRVGRGGLCGKRGGDTRRPTAGTLETGKPVRGERAPLTQGCRVTSEHRPGEEAALSPLPSPRLTSGRRPDHGGEWPRPPAPGHPSSGAQSREPSARNPRGCELRPHKEPHVQPVGQRTQPPPERPLTASPRDDPRVSP